MDNGVENKTIMYMFIVYHLYIYNYLYSAYTAPKIDEMPAKYKRKNLLNFN